jgi:small subunit ribosomal protein S21
LTIRESNGNIVTHCEGVEQDRQAASLGVSVVVCNQNSNRREWSVVTVKLREGESFDSLLRRFNKEVMEGGVMKDLRRRRWFVPKGEQRRMDERKGRRRARMQRLRREQEEG